LPLTGESVVDGAKPIANSEFDSWLAALGPFEPKPHVAVAVSGGADSLALCLLTAAWTRRRGGMTTALTVDHGLRRGAAAEARRVAGWLAGCGIRHRTLRWTGIKPTRNIQAEARTARYELLSRWCRRHGILHLFLGHHLEDQAETLLLRLARGSGAEGLAAMAAIQEMRDLRWLRPLLGVPKARLVATLERRGQEWVEDPTNADIAHARVRIRSMLPNLAREGASTERLAATAGRLGRVRAVLEADTAALLARAVAAHPAGFCHLSLQELIAAPADIALRALARILVTIGGQAYPPRHERLERLYDNLVTGSISGGWTLAGCRITPRRDGIVVCREPGRMEAAVHAAPNTTVPWDRRYKVDFGRAADANARVDARLGPLTTGGWAEIAKLAPTVRGTAIPPTVRPTLPTLRDRHGVICVPHLHYGRSGGPPASLTLRAVRFEPARPLAGAGFAVVSALRSPISMGDETRGQPGVSDIVDADGGFAPGRRG